jgi:hypothetical protein
MSHIALSGRSGSLAEHSANLTVKSIYIRMTNSYARAMANKLDSTQFRSDEIDPEEYRARLRKITDEELIREGKAGRCLCSPMANFSKPPRKVFVVQLEEVNAEWRRRHPNNDSDGSNTPS